MLQVASGPSAYSHVINPDGSDIDTAVDRFTLLHLYGGFADQATAALTGTVVTGSPTEADIVDGGQTLIVTLTNDTWVAAGATFNAERQNIIDGLDDAALAAGLAVGDVVRTSDTVVTITFSAIPTYDITSDSVVEHTVPASALVSSASAVVASELAAAKAASELSSKLF